MLHRKYSITMSEEIVRDEGRMKSLGRDLFTRSNDKRRPGDESKVNFNCKFTWLAPHFFTNNSYGIYDMIC